MHLSIVLNRLLFSINEGQVTDVEQAVIITNNNLMLHFSGYNNDLLVLKQWKVVLNRIMPSLLGLLENNDLALCARSLGTLRSDDGDGNGNAAKTIGLISKTTILHVHHAFLYISLPSLHDYDVKMPNFTMYRGSTHATTKFPLSF